MNLQPRLLFLPACICLAMLLNACKETPEDPGTVRIRIENDSPEDFKTIQVSSGGATIDFGDVAAGRSSGYKVFASAYRYGYVQTRVKGQRYVCQPIDYVGETKLSPGKYTYKISLAAYPNGLSLTFKKD